MNNQFLLGFFKEAQAHDIDPAFLAGVLKEASDIVATYDAALTEMEQSDPNVRQKIASEILVHGFKKQAAGEWSNDLLSKIQDIIGSLGLQNGNNASIGGGIGGGLLGLLAGALLKHPMLGMALGATGGAGLGGLSRGGWLAELLQGKGVEGATGDSRNNLVRSLTPAEGQAADTYNTDKITPDISGGLNDTYGMSVGQFPKGMNPNSLNGGFRKMPSEAALSEGKFQQQAQDRFSNMAQLPSNASKALAGTPYAHLLNTPIEGLSPEQKSIIGQLANSHASTRDILTRTKNDIQNSQPGLLDKLKGIGLTAGDSVNNYTKVFDPVTAAQTYGEMSTNPAIASNAKKLYNAGMNVAGAVPFSPVNLYRNIGNLGSAVGTPRPVSPLTPDEANSTMGSAIPPRKRF